jgi:hypothetical protein
MKRPSLVSPASLLTKMAPFRQGCANWIHATWRHRRRVVIRYLAPRSGLDVACRHFAGRDLLQLTTPSGSIPVGARSRARCVDSSGFGACSFVIGYHFPFDIVRLILVRVVLDRLLFGCLARLRDLG